MKDLPILRTPQTLPSKLTQLPAGHFAHDPQRKDHHVQAPIEKPPPFVVSTESAHSSKRNGGSSRGRTLAMETLESRQMLSITPLQNINSSGSTGEKPQSKIFEYAGQWWSVMPSSSGTSVFRLDGTTWTATQQITTNDSVQADVKLVGDVAHVLLFDGNSTQLASLQYDSGPDNRFEPWSVRPQPGERATPQQRRDGHD